MAKKRGNPDLKKYHFKKNDPKNPKNNDPRINRKGQPKKIPVLKALMAELVGHTDSESLDDSEIGAIVKALIAENGAPGSNLTPEQVAEIRAKRARGDSLRVIAADIGVPFQSIHRSIAGQTYRS